MTSIVAQTMLRSPVVPRATAAAVFPRTAELPMAGQQTNCKKLLRTVPRLFATVQSHGMEWVGAVLPMQRRSSNVNKKHLCLNALKTPKMQLDLGAIGSLAWKTPENGVVFTTHQKARVEPWRHTAPKGPTAVRETPRKTLNPSF